MKFRPFLEKLMEINELKTIDKEVDWNLEIAAISTKSFELGGPALHFKKVKDYPECSMVTGFLAGPQLSHVSHPPFRGRKPWSRIAVAMGLDPTVLYTEFLDTYITRMNQPIKPIEVKTGPCKEVILKGKDIDILKFPVPFLHKNDGGRYGSGIVIVKDPETGWQHWGWYRWMVKDKNTLVGNFPENSPLKKIYEKYEAQNKPMPFCIVLGAEPITMVASMMSLTEGADVPGVAGGLQLDPIELVPAETSDLIVPASAEIVIEGEVPPKKRMEEGPYPNFYCYEPKTSQPIYKINTITHRKDPIFPFTVTAAKASDEMVIKSIVESAQLTFMCKAAALPVSWVLLPIEARLGWCIVGATVAYKGFVFQLANYLFSWTNRFNKMLIVDGTYIPEYQFARAIIQDWLVKPRPRLGEGWLLYDNDAPVPLSVKYPVEKTTSRLITNSTYDPLWPKEWIAPLVSFETVYPETLQEKVLKRYKELGFQGEPVVFEWMRKKKT